MEILAYFNSYSNISVNVLQPRSYGVLLADTSGMVVVVRELKNNILNYLKLKNKHNVIEILIHYLNIDPFYLLLKYFCY